MNRFVLLLIIILLACVLGSHANPGAADIAVVVNRDVPIDNLTFSELRKIVLGDRQFWSSNLRVTLLIRAPAARERDVLLQNVVQMSESQFRQYWIGKVFRAESSAGPKTVYSNEMSLSLINSIPGAVAFIDASQVPKDSKIVRLSGLLPGEKGYPLN
jgi:ABC-type phosphate transport system substrate-binding protein